MSVLPLESLQSANVSEAQSPLDELNNHFGADYVAILRKDYQGSAAHKVQVGSAIIVLRDVLTPEGVKREETVVDDTHRPVSEAACALLGTRAAINWHVRPELRRIRDYSASERS